MSTLFDQIEEARAAVAAHTSLVPRVGVILGSGLSAIADRIAQSVVISYQDIPHVAVPSVEGHAGSLVLGVLAGQPTAVMRGRLHFYEGLTMQQVTFPVRVLRALGCELLVVTNAAGCLRPDWQVGDIMCISDQIFLPGLMGNHPLRGRNDERLGQRFPPMLGAFDADLARLAAQVAAEQGTTLRSGVYVMIGGPSFETAAELRLLRASGADAVGMSTAPEVVVARHAGMRVLGLSLLTNMALPDGSPATHAEVLETGTAALPTFAALLPGILERLDG